MQVLNRATRRQMVKWLASYEDEFIHIRYEGKTLKTTRMDFLRIRNSELHQVRDLILRCYATHLNRHGTEVNASFCFFIQGRQIMLEQSDWERAIRYREDGMVVSTSIMTYEN